MFWTNHNNRIQKFARDGKFITNWGTEGSGDGQLRGPRELSVSSSVSSMCQMAESTVLMYLLW